MRIGPYEVERELGRGGMGAAYRARHSATGAAVVVKTLHLLDGERLARFEREARIGKSLDHRGIVRTLDFGREAAGPYLVMELVEGETLAAHIARGPLDPWRAAALVRDIAEAVEHAHRSGVVHRDLKPSNVLLDGAGRPRVADFGLSRAEGDERLTATGDTLGTPHYLPPEQVARGASAHGPPGDIWSLGAILHEALAGQPPFRAATAVNVLAKIAREAPEPLPAGTPRALVAIVRRCLEKEPAARFPTAGALARALDETLAKGRAGTGSGLARWLASGAVVAGLVAAGAWTLRKGPGALPLPASVPPAVPTPPPPTTPAPPHRPSTPTAAELVTHAEKLRRDNRLEEALAAFEKASALDPTSLAALDGRIVALAELDRPEESARLARSIPEASRPRRAQIVAAGTSLETLLVLDALIADSNADDAALGHFIRARLAVGRKEMTLALTEAQAAVFNAGWSACYLLFLARLEGIAGDREAELLTLERVASVQAEPPPIFFYERGMCRIQLGLDGAKEDFTRCIDSGSPVADFALFARAKLEQALGHHERAIEDFAGCRKRLKTRDESIASRRLAADSCAVLGRHDEALALLLEALEFDPIDNFTLDTAVRVFAARPASARDAEDLRRAVDAPGATLTQVVLMWAAAEARGDKKTVDEAHAIVTSIFQRKRVAEDGTLSERRQRARNADAR